MDFSARKKIYKTHGVVPKSTRWSRQNKSSSKSQIQQHHVDRQIFHVHGAAPQNVMDPSSLMDSQSSLGTCVTHSDNNQQSTSQCPPSSGNSEVNYTQVFFWVRHLSLNEIGGPRQPWISPEECDGGIILNGFANCVGHVWHIFRQQPAIHFSVFTILGKLRGESKELFPLCQAL